MMNHRESGSARSESGDDDSVRDATDEPQGGGGMATGRVLWYSGSRGAGVVETEDGGTVMAFLPGAAQDDLGGVCEGDPVALSPAVSVFPPADPDEATAAGELGAGGAGALEDETCGAIMFPLGLDRFLAAGRRAEDDEDAPEGGPGAGG